MRSRRTAPPRRRAALSVLLCAIAAIGALAAPRAARADEGFALSRFEPAPAGDRLLGVPSPFTAGAPEVSGLPLHLAAIADYAHAPLVLRGATTGKSLGAVVSDQLVLHLSGSYALLGRLTLNLDLPATFQSGSGPSTGGVSYAEPPVAAIGDLRLAARVTLLGHTFDRFQLAAGAMLWVPSGSTSAFAGDGKVRGEPQIIAGGAEGRWLVWSAAAGVRLRPAAPAGDLRPGSSVELGGGLGFTLDEDRALMLGPQITASIDLNDPNARTTAVELLLAAKRRISPDFEAGFGLGTGLSAGIGTPSLRAVLSFAWSPEAVPFVPRPPVQRSLDADRDGDGIPDALDACPGEKGPKNDNPRQNGCPRPADRDGDGVLDHEDRCPDEAGPAGTDPERRGCPPLKDRDGDGIPDEADACPAESGPADADPKKNGCPPQVDDRDGDGIPDATDACPDQRGLATMDAKTTGCPPNSDSDGDGIPDDKDACPHEKGPASKVADQHGCPTAVRVTADAILFLQPLVFDGQTAVLPRVNAPVLDQLAAVLAEHPEILRVEVQGHTDNKGKRPAMLELSQKRAEAVQKALVDRGVASARIVAKGYGGDRPIAANLTTEGRAKNRRVEIKILETRGK
ncbi:MAG: OmpA family protein [Byssovorax sp.]